jgi:hypothetical protein
MREYHTLSTVLLLAGISPAVHSTTVAQSRLLPHAIKPCKDVMRIITVLLLTVIMTAVGLAQSTEQPTSGQFSVTLTTSSASTARKGDQLLETKKNQVASIIILWRVSSGGDTITVELDPANITITGCDIIDTMSTPELFEQLAQTAIAQGLAQGIIPCSSSCSTGPITRVLTPACVTRAGTGCDTRFASCDTMLQAIHDYRVCCPIDTGNATIVLVFSTSPNCVDPECESTAW